MKPSYFYTVMGEQNYVKKSSPLNDFSVQKVHTSQLEWQQNKVTFKLLVPGVKIFFIKLNFLSTLAQWKYVSVEKTILHRSGYLQIWYNLTCKISYVLHMRNKGLSFETGRAFLIYLWFVKTKGSCWFKKFKIPPLLFNQARNWQLKL